MVVVNRGYGDKDRIGVGIEFGLIVGVELRSWPSPKSKSSIEVEARDVLVRCGAQPGPEVPNVHSTSRGGDVLELIVPLHVGGVADWRSSAGECVQALDGGTRVRRNVSPTHSKE